MGIESPVHLIFIGLVALIVLGPKRLPELARALGQGIREFRGAIEQAANAPETGEPHGAEPASLQPPIAQPPGLPAPAVAQEAADPPPPAEPHDS